MRKNLLLSALLLSSVGMGYARTLTPEEALSRVGQGGPSKVLSQKLTQSTLVETGSYNNMPTYYVFVKGNQTLFVGADDLAEPLLGYIDNGDYNQDKMPPQLKWWLSEYSREIEYASKRESKGVVGRRARVQFDQTVSRPAKASRQAISPLCKTTWDQAAPYNNLCPTKNGTRTYTGCVATAMAQVMKYHEYPAKGVGSNSYTWNNQTLSMNFASTTFDWNNMLNTYASSSSGTSAQRTAIATLMKACGYAVNMTYGVDSDGGSGATSFDITPALVNNFSYDKATHTEFRDYYSETEWEDMIYDNLKNVGPVVYCGASNQGGHCFVCDGYNTSGYFHINWGWSGSYDGYFKLSALNPEGQGIGGYAGGYNSQQDATLGIRKPQTGSVLPEAYLAIEGTLTATASSRAITFKATNGGFYNMSCYSGTFSVGLALTSGSSTQYVGETSLGTVKPGYGTASLQLTVPSSVSVGSYKASLVYKVGSGSWKPFKYHYGSPSSIDITVSSSGVTIGASGTTTDGAITVTKATSSTGYVVGQTATVTATVKNTYSTSKTVSISAYLCQVSGSSYSVKAQLGTNSVTVPANSTKTSTFSATLSSSLATGTYYLVFADADNYIINDPVEVQVTQASSTTGEISVTSMSSSTGFTIGQSATVAATFKNTYSTSKTITAKALICSKGTSGYTIKATLASQSVTLSAGGTKNVNFTGTVPSTLSAGSYYLIIADSSNNILSDIQTIEVKEAASEDGEITVTSATSSTGFTIGQTAKVSMTVKNTYSSTQSVTLKAYLCTKGTSSYSIAENLGSTTVSVGANASKTASISTTLSTSITAGTYYLVVCDLDNYILNTPSAVNVKAASSGDNTTNMSLSINSVTTSTGFTAGSTCKLTVKFGNSTSSTQKATVTPTFYTKSGSTYTKVATLSAKSVSVTSGYTKSVTFSSTLSSALSSGTYYLQFIDENGANVGNKIYSLSVTGSTSRYSVRSFSMANPDDVDADNVQLNVEVEANENVRGEQFVALIYPAESFDLGEVSIALFDSHDLEEGTVSNIQFFGELAGLEVGKRYSAVLFTLSGESFFSGFEYVNSIDFTVKKAGTQSIQSLEEGDVDDTEATYYNLHGVKVDTDNLIPGMYIKVQGGRASKICVK